MPFWQFDNQTFTPIADDALLENILQTNAQTGRKTAIGLIGSGGKTTLLHLLAHQAADKGFLTFAGTTTHLAFEGSFLTSFGDVRKVLLEQQKTRCQRQLTRSPVFAAAIADGYAHKLSSFTSDENGEIYQLSEVSLWEADGSKRLPLKVPRDTEPCLESWFSDLVLIVGLAAAGQPLGQVCHCFELLQKSCPDLSAETSVDAKVLAEVLRSGYLRRADLFGSMKSEATVKPRRVHLLFNHCDTREELKLAEATAALLPAEAFSGIYAASLKGYLDFSSN
ncbi:MAG: putative selenium-dependent hydroxylase accessory protein YqeC [Clostridiales bacterium]|nr:putative selenium-dependent hydroxylase accessory protein YqeC [Clostridiales bacterium]MDD7433256.1 selenium cofactor biosynthesis protein YqeC [Clostridiales bacterium]MDY3062339.1 selenium cofactor biosynthesis protein YqeC [Eubacteriales bacterium]